MKLSTSNVLHALVSRWRRICLRDTSACSTLEVDNFMRYINLLTYLFAVYLVLPYFNYTMIFTCNSHASSTGDKWFKTQTISHVFSNDHNRFLLCTNSVECNKILVLQFSENNHDNKNTFIYLFIIMHDNQTVQCLNLNAQCLYILPILCVPTQQPQTAQQNVVSSELCKIK